MTRRLYLLLAGIMAMMTLPATGQTVTIGSGASSVSGVNGTPIYRSSAASTFNYSKSIQLLTQADLAAAGVVNGSTITAVAWYKNDAFVVNSGYTANMTIQAKNSSATALATGTSWTAMTAGSTTVYSNAAQTFPAAAGWITFTFSTPLTYTGGALEFYLDWAITPVTANSTNGAFSWKYDATTNAQAMGTSAGSAIANTNTSWTTATRRYQTQVTYTPGAACSGTPATGTATASVTNACSGVPFTISVSGIAAASNITYQLQSSAPGANSWNNVGSAQSGNTFTIPSQIAATDYRVIVACTSSGGGSSTTNVLAIGQNAATACYCSPTTNGGGGTYYISNFATTGATTNINNASGNGGAAGYTDFSGSVSGSAVQGATVNYVFTTMPAASTFGRAIWFDLNHDGDFADAGEQVASSAAYSTNPSGSFTIPLSATPGITRMRVLASFTPNNPSNPCSNTGAGEYEDYAFNIIQLTGCSGTPATGTASASVTNACAGTPFTISVAGVTAESGITFQLQSSAAGANSWNNVGSPQATNSFTIPSQIAASDYRVIVNCSNSGLSSTTNIVAVGQNAPTACYCTPTTTNGATYYIANFATTGPAGSTNINNASGAGGATGYTDFFGSVSGSAVQGATVNYAFTTMPAASTFGRAIWFDLNHDGDFADAGEQVASSAAYSTNPAGSFVIPLGATPGITRMRVLASFTPNNPSDPCANSGQGEYEDYAFNIIQLVGCSGTPATGTASATVTNACSGTPFTISVAGVTVESGITFQLQTSAPGANTWTNSGAAQAGNSFTVASQTTATDYRVVVNCSNSGLNSTTNVLAIGQNAPSACYCVPSTTSAATYFISNFTLTGGTTNINNNSATSPDPSTYTDFTGTVSGSAVQGATLNYSIGVTGGGTHGRAIWIDFNQDGDFADAGEQVGSSTAYAATPLTGSFTIPLGATPGATRLRIQSAFTPNNPSNPCAGTGAGEYEDYAFTVIQLAACTGTPTPGTASAMPASVCVSGTTTLTLTGYTTGVSGISIQWEQGTTATGPWSAISGATSATYTTPTLTSTAYYRAAVTCGASSQTAYSNVLTISVDNPVLVSSAGGQRCGPGVVSLTATANASNTVNWYASSTGGSPIATGSPFNTTISSTTTYYVAAAAPGATGISTAGLINSCACGTFGNPAVANYGLRFQVTSPGTLLSVAGYPSAAGTISIRLYDDAGNPLSAAQNFTVTAGQVNTKVVFPVNLNLTTTGFYRIVETSTGILNRYNPYSGPAFPMTSGGAISVVNALTSITSAPSTTTYYAFFDFQYQVGCEGPRTAVTATVNTAPGLTAATSASVICANEIATLSVTSNTTDFNSYEWTPTTNLYTNAAATTPYTGGSATTLYVKGGNTAGLTTYTVDATNSGTTCTNVAQVDVTTQPSTATVAASPSPVCISSGATTLSLTPGTGYATSLVQWQTSPNGATYNDITGATGASYNATGLTANTYFRAVIKNSAGSTCSQPQTQVIVENPSVLTTAPGTRCGPGTVTLGATTASGNTLKWYANATGGAPLATGPSYTTPSISATTNYYVSALGAGAQIVSGGRTAPAAAAAGTALTNYGEVFEATQAFTLNSVKVYPSSTTVAPTFSVELRDNTNAVLQTAGPFTLPVGTGTTGATATAQTVTLNFAVPVGTGYRLVIPAMNTGGNLIREGTGITYPIAIGSVGNITNPFLLNAVGTSATYYWFYDWQVTVGCEGARTAVAATVTPPPAVTITTDDADNTICAGQQSVALTAQSPNDPNYAYSWAPGGATGATTSVSPATTTQYTVTANDAVSGCITSAAVTINVNAVPNPTVTPANQAIGCGGATAAININSVMPGVVTVQSGTLALTPADNSATGVSHALSVSGVPAGSIIDSVIVTLNATSTFLGDFDINLMAPNGQVINLVENVGGSGDNFVNTRISSAGTVAMPSAATNNITGTWAASAAAASATINTANDVTTQTWAPLFSTPNGNWTLYVYDDAAAIVGTVTGYDIKIAYRQPTTVSFNTTQDLYTNAAGTTPFVNGTAATVVYAKPSADMSYTVSATANGCTSVADSADVAQVEVNSGTTGLADATTATNTETFFQVGMVDVRNNDCELMFSLAPTGTNPVSGFVSASLSISGSAGSTPNDEPFAGRLLTITPATGASTATGTVTLYMTNAEMVAYNASLATASNQGWSQMPVTPNDTNVSHIRVTKFPGTAGWAAGQGVLLTPTNAYWDATLSAWVIEVQVNGFSTFYVHSANGSNSPLPVTLVRVGATNVGNRNKVEWESATEHDLASYIVERSTDGNTFTRMDEVTAAGKAQGYITYDNQPNAGLTYYRLKMMDLSGAFVYSETVKAFMSRDGEVVVTAQPNPVRDVLTVNIYGAQDGQAQLTDVSGRMVASVAVSNGQATFNTNALAAGTYFVKWSNGAVSKTVKVTKQ